MSEEPDIYVTGVLTRDQLLQAARALTKFIQCHFLNGLVRAEYGYGCKLHPALCYRDMEVGVGWLDKFVNDSLRQEIVVLGDSDFTIACPNDRMIVLFCHEGDIHVRGTDVELLSALWCWGTFKELPLIRAPHLPERQKPKQPWF